MTEQIPSPGALRNNVPEYWSNRLPWVSFHQVSWDVVTDSPLVLKRQALLRSGDRIHILAIVGERHVISEAWDLNAVVSYHKTLGSLVKAEAGTVQPRIHVYTGGADNKMVPSDQVSGLVKEMQDAEADLMLVSFPGVLHSFTKPGADKVTEEFNMPIAYNENAANRLWKGTMQLYNEVFSN